jgi:YVTN family beta-propeller protein
MAIEAVVTRNTRRMQRTAVAAVALLICTSCGETYRPVANPITPNPPNPGFSHVAMVLSSNGNNNPGAGTTIDVSGDTAVSQAALGLVPSYAILSSNSSKAWVTNSLDDTVSQFSPSNPTPVTTISLPTGSAPAFAGTAENGAVYVANSGNNTVSVIAVFTNAVSNTVPVGAAPIALAETPAIPGGQPQKIYVANQGGSVSVVSSVDKTAGFVPGAWVSPVWVSARSDANRVYVLDSGAGTVSAIDTASDTVVGSSAAVGTGANFMAYDSARNRLYVTNQASSVLSIVDVSNDLLSVTPLSVANPVAVAILPPNGSRVYVASAVVSGGNVASRVIVVDAARETIKTTIPLATVAQSCASTRFELSVAASADGTRVYVGNCDAGNTSIIQTSTDTIVTNLPAPLSAIQPSALKITAALQSGTTTIYTYTPVSGPPLRLGMTMVVENMQKTVDNGTFAIVGLGTGTFTVVNPGGVTLSGQSGTGTGLTPQNPVLVVAGS